MAALKLFPMVHHSQVTLAVIHHSPSLMIAADGFKTGKWKGVRAFVKQTTHLIKTVHLPARHMPLEAFNITHLQFHGSLMTCLKNLHSSAHIICYKYDYSELIYQ